MRPDSQRKSTAQRHLRQVIDQTHPHGWFVAIDEDQVVGAAATFGELEGLLRAEGLDPRRLLVVEAGIDYPENVTIFV
jgi:hypothetical protein